MTAAEFASHQLHLIGAEQAAETAQNGQLLSSAPLSALVTAGLAVTNLVTHHQRTGLGGRTVVELERDPAISGKEIGSLEHGLRTGDIVRVSEQPKGSERKADKAALDSRGSNGVVTRVRSHGLEIALEEGSEDECHGLTGRRLWVLVATEASRLMIRVKLANDVVYRR